MTGYKQLCEKFIEKLNTEANGRQCMRLLSFISAHVVMLFFTEAMHVFAVPILVDCHNDRGELLQSLLTSIFGTELMSSELQSRRSSSVDLLIASVNPDALLCCSGDSCAHDFSSDGLNVGRISSRTLMMSSAVLESVIVSDIINSNAQVDTKRSSCKLRSRAHTSAWRSSVHSLKMS